MSPTYVLVHGGWSGGWIWDDVVARLREQGEEALAVEQMPSAGPDRGALGDLTADVDHLTGVVDGVGGPVALVGHSSGGMAVTELGDHPAVVHSVYVAAAWPEPGQPLVQVFDPPAFARPLDENTLGMADDLDLVHETVAADLDRGTMESVRDRYVLQSMSSAGTPARAPEHGHPTTYVVCDADRTVPPATQERLAAKADRVVHLDASHSPMLSRPVELADAIAGAVRSGG